MSNTEYIHTDRKQTVSGKTNKKAAVFILLGQSNAVGHGVPMEPQDIINLPLKNVYGLDRKNNQSFSNTELLWSGYTSHGMNLAEEQDNTYSLCNCLASLWQKEPDLPELYIIQIAIGAQGVTDGFMWYPKREEKLIPGKLGTVDISLFPYSLHIFSLLDKSFKKMGKDYEIIGLHWRGGEEDTTSQNEKLKATLSNIYSELIDGFNKTLHTPPIILHRIVCRDRVNDFDPSGGRLQNMEYINSVFCEKEQQYKNVCVFDVRKAPQFVENVRGNGIFIDDVVHYSPETNFWVAQQILDEYKKIH